MFVLNSYSFTNATLNDMVVTPRSHIVHLSLTTVCLLVGKFSFVLRIVDEYLADELAVIGKGHEIVHRLLDGFCLGCREHVPMLVGNACFGKVDDASDSGFEDLTDLAHQSAQQLNDKAVCTLGVFQLSVKILLGIGKNDIL